MDAIQNALIGKKIDEVVLYLNSIGATYRVSVDKEQTMLTADYVENRINLHVNKEGIVLSIFNG